jgi:Kef-type K+ transport system membrane component KefB
MAELPKEFQYILLLFGLLVLPKALQRFRVPSAITTLMLGVGFGAGLGYFTQDETVHLLATFGIAALFLFAGLDVDGGSLRREARILSEHLLIVSLTVTGAAGVVMGLFPLSTREAVLVGLALVTPSCGFILDSLSSLGVSSEEGYWIRTKAIASELLALAVLFVTLQSTSISRLGISAIALLAMAAFLPVLLRFLASRVSSYAPNSEFAFLLMVAVIFAYATRQLGVYYLVGAFLVGITARRMRDQLPRLASDQNLHAVEVFASFFVPFYFFNAGLGISREALSWQALGIGLAFAGVSIPVRIGLVLLQRRVRLSEAWSQAMRVAVPMIPTLVFTLVLAEILRAEFSISPSLFGGLIVYAALTTILPAMVFRAPRAAFEIEQEMLLVGSAAQARTGPAPIEADGAVPDLAAADGAVDHGVPARSTPSA